MQQSTLLRTQEGLTYRGLNKNGRLDIYEDPRQPIAARIDDLLGQMTLEEKAGLLFINGATVNADGSIEASVDDVGTGTPASSPALAPVAGVDDDHGDGDRDDRDDDLREDRRGEDGGDHGGEREGGDDGD